MNPKFALSTVSMNGPRQLGEFAEGLLEVSKTWMLLQKCWSSQRDGDVSGTLDIWKGTACLGLGALIPAEVLTCLS